MLGTLGSLASPRAQAAEPESPTPQAPPPQPAESATPQAPPPQPAEAATPQAPPPQPAEPASPSPSTDPAPSLAPRRTLDERFSRGTIVGNDTPPLRRNRRNTIVYRDPGGRFVAKIEPDGRAHFRDRFVNFRHQRMMGPYEIALKARGTELHQSAKRSFLRSTYANRLAMRVEWTLDNLRHAEQRLWGELREIWEDETMTRAERERILRQRWAECDVDVEIPPYTDGVSRVDLQRRTVARRARRTIEHFVRVYVDPQASFDEVAPAGDAAIALAPDLFEECERDPTACIAVGDLLVGRRANAFDAGRGAQYYARACNANDPWACYELAVLHYLGLGVERDDTRAAELHDVACEAGVAQGCAHLVHLHRKGFGVPRSATDAAHYEQLACDRGLEDYC